ncbi:solute carrier family 12 member 9-like [Lytechinus variegatus]|uniref:solute carrier family 12 member 9-like n=1 Tax=Lytechinus variegatus TaxID=7654 RepID=UPI001BB132CC|nr:solute carrier family 12 member 9-like [Lytechinus variegatus]
MTDRSSKSVSYGGVESHYTTRDEINEVEAGSRGGNNMTVSAEISNGGRAATTTASGPTSGTSGDESTPLLRYELDRSISKNPINSARNLSTLFGCFMPCVLSIFSAILFLRVGFAIGHAGLLETIGMFTLGYFIVLLTVLSLCAISTNGAVEGGGAYFMISRALGPELGGSIGFIFYLANVFSCAFNSSAFTEILEDNFGASGSLVRNGIPTGGPNKRWWTFLYSSSVLMFCFLVCLIGAKMFARTTGIIFLTVLAAIVTVIVNAFIQEPFEVHLPTDNPLIAENATANYTGLSLETLEDNLFAHYTKDYTTLEPQTFLTVFAIVFNGITGIMAGANMSGELRNPGRAIPLGTLGGCAFTAIIYIIVFLLVAATCTRDLLINDYNFLQHVNVVGPLIAVGVIAATLSTSLSTLIGGSRVLVALAKDRVFGSVTNPIARGITKDGNPIAALIVCWFMVQMVLFIGELNAIGPLVSVFFLLSYACVNLACLALEVASAPNFRPSFKYFSWHTSLLGMIGCIVMLFLIEPIWAFAAIGLFIFLLVVVIIWGPHNQWGYVSQALIFHQVRKYLLLLDVRKAHVKFWRPQILLLVSNPRASTQLIRFVNDMKKSGLYVIGHVKTGFLDEFPYDPVQQEYPAWLYLVESLKVKAFVELTLAPTVREGVTHLMRISGLGGMKPNTVVMGFYDDKIPVNSLSQSQAEKQSRFRFNTDDEEEEMGNVLTQFPKLRAETETKALSADQYVLMICDAIRLRKNICLARHFSSLDMDALQDSSRDSYIDVWPINFLKPELAGYLDTACIFLLQLACVLHMVPKWNRHTRLRVFLCVDSDYQSTQKKKDKLNKFLVDLRIYAEVVTVPWNHITSLNTYQMNQMNGDAAPSLVRSISDEYLLALNQMVRDHTASTAVVFGYLPLPPADPQYHMTYLHHLNLLTKDLPPSVLVHGFSEVTSTVM